MNHSMGLTKNHLPAVKYVSTNASTTTVKTNRPKLVKIEPTRRGERIYVYVDGSWEYEYERINQPNP